MHFRNWLGWMGMFWVAAAGLEAREEKSSTVPAELAAYVARPDDSYSWKVEQAVDVENLKLLRLSLQSQTWQGIAWTHDLIVAVPAGVPLKTVMLLNDGGSASEEQSAFAAGLARKIQAPVAILLGVPKQPLFGGKKEDDLIAETFARYLESGDASWPLLFPMVKSVVRAMDALQELSRREGVGPVESFIVGGASKRGWTTWLTAASDPRVKAITPMVIDVLNMPEQLHHQKASLGSTSDEISPYTKRGLTPDAEGERPQELWRMVDPWSYRARFEIPKLIVLGNNDPYWSTDALNIYWEDLPGEKYISYSPNAGHNLVEAGSNRDRAVNNLAAFVRHQLTGVPMPKLSWDWSDQDGKSILKVSSDQAPGEARLWWAHADTRDFRKAHWESRVLEVKDGQSVIAEVKTPEKGYIAYYADLGYKVDGIPQWLCTQLKIIGNGAGK